MREIVLANGRGVALVDDEDYERLSQYRWHLSTNKYAVRGMRKTPMHADVMGRAPEGYEIDHINRNRLDNRRSNLRWATHMQNMHNRIHPQTATGSSRFRGVQWDGKRWAVRLNYNGKSVLCTHRKDEIEAARLYDEVAKKYFGEFAILNFPDE